MQLLTVTFLVAFVFLSEGGQINQQNRSTAFRAWDDPKHSMGYRF